MPGTIVTPEDAVRLAIEVAEVGLDAGEMPIGAVVFYGDDVIGCSEDLVRDQFRRYAADDTRPASMRAWCDGLAAGE